MTDYFLFRLKLIMRDSGEVFIPQIKRRGFLSRWKYLYPERMYPEIVRVHVDKISLFGYSKEEALKIIEVYKREQEEKKIRKIEYINL